MSNKQGKMLTSSLPQAGYINWRMRVTLNDGRAMTGQMLAFDKHMNLVLADTEEFRRVKRKQNKPTAPGASGSATQTIESEEKRTLGLTIVRGAHIISLSVESPPPADPSARLGKSAPGGIPSALAAGPGVARPAGRGAAPPSLAGPAAGVGGAPPPGFPGFPGAPGFPGRGAPPPGFPGNFPPPAGFPGGAQFPPPGFNPGGPPPPGFQPPPRR
ncbi:small nuclear ribonucleoprotein B and B [Fusarium sp. NRRL 52700]|nr:small nuclear ribonucleoprotein B and B [Fusarium sp. NRRL 52700]